jgi:DNA-binding response OmpR family regulator
VSNLTSTAIVSELPSGSEFHDWPGPAGDRLQNLAFFKPGMVPLERRAAKERAARILIVDHDSTVAPIFRQTLADTGHRIESTEGMQFEAAALREYAPQCMILNLNPRDGKRPFNLIDEARSWFQGPIMVVSDVCSESTKVSAFERGADDYACVPFGLREFAARVDALLRRTASPSPARHFKVGPLHIDRAARSAFLNGQALALTHKEFDILFCLARNPGVVISAEALLSEIWGSGFVHYNQTLRVHISNLRRKLRSVTAFADFIRSVPGNGYLLAIQPPSPSH